MNMALWLKGRFVPIRMAPATEDVDGGDEIEEVDEEEEEEAATPPPPPPSPPPRGRVVRGCVSKQNRRCTQNARHCRDDDT